MASAASSTSTATKSPAGLAAIHARMKAVTGVARLPLRSGQWSGTAGSVLGQGTGSSVDFQDQRAYMPGDDPRHINWQAYARSGNYTMKLYRQEVTPKVDILFDASPSMFLTPQKATRTWELLYFCLESALRLGASTRVHALDDESRETPVDRALAYDWPLQEKLTGVMLPSLLERTPLRAGSLRILLSDLLSESPPDRVTVKNPGSALPSAVSAVFTIVTVGRSSSISTIVWLSESASSRSTTASRPRWCAFPM